MNLVTPRPQIEKDDAFDKHDIFNRKQFGESLLNLVVNSNSELVISLDGKWGEGKTFFVKMWQGLLNQSKIPNIYINAFSIDYLDDAFISIMSEIKTYAEEHIKPDHKEIISELKEKTKKVGGQLLSLSARLAIKAATLNIVKDSDIEELKGISGDLSNTTSDIVGKFIDERLESHSENVKMIESFREFLSDLPLKLQNGSNAPLVIIIDELDRCKPTFAVEVLEKIKHLFSVENVVFLLVINKEQLEESIKCVYGMNLDAHTYLQKFVNIEAKLPKQTHEAYNNDISKYIKELFHLHSFETWGDERGIMQYLELISKYYDLSFRQLEKIFTNLVIFYQASNKNSFRPCDIIVFLSVLKVYKPKVFNSLLKKELSYTHFLEKIGFTLENEGNLRGIIRMFKLCLLNDSDYSALSENDKRMEQRFWHIHLDRTDIIPHIAQRLCMFKYQ